MTEAFAEYALLLEQFLSGAMSVDEFQSAYLDRFKNEKRRLDESVFEVLDGIFGDLDSFTNDSELLAENPEFYLDEDKLRERVRSAINILSTLRI